MNTLPQLMQRVMALFILAALLILVFAYLVYPVYASYANKYDETKVLTDRLARYRNLIDSETVIDDRLAQLEQDDARGALFLEGEKAAIASANMQDIINSAVRDSGGQLVSTQEYQVESSIGAPAVGLRVQMMGETNHLVALLHTLEASAQPLIFVDAINVNSSAVEPRNYGSSRRIRPRRSAGNPRGERYSLNIRLDLIGYLAEGK